jgi:hypothetical protein
LGRGKERKKEWDCEKEGKPGYLRVVKGLREEPEDTKERIKKWLDITRQCIQIEEKRLREYQQRLREGGNSN